MFAQVTRYVLSTSVEASERCRRKFLVLATITALCTGLLNTVSAADQDAAADSELLTLLTVTQSAAQANAVSEKQLTQFEKTGFASQLTPLRRFLIAEIYRLRNDSENARRVYTEIVHWANSNPYDDHHGGSGVAVVALWRLAELAESLPLDKKLINNVLEAAGVSHRESVKDEELPQWNRRRLWRGMFYTPFLESMPQLEEDIARRLASLAWSVDKKDLALRLFFEYLTITSVWEPKPHEEQMLQDAVAKGLVSADRLDLFIGKRLVSLKNYDTARQRLGEAYKSNNLHVKAEAGLYLASIRYINRDPRQETADMLSEVIETAVDTDVILDALYLRHEVYKRRGFSVQGFRNDLERIIKEYPDNRRVNNAYYLLARSYEASGDFERALHYYEMLRQHRGPSEYRKASSYYFPALTLYRRGKPGDLEQAMGILRQLIEDRPDNGLLSHARFWLGRMYEESGNKTLAKTKFDQLIADSPFDYYAVRARMHLNLNLNLNLEQEQEQEQEQAQYLTLPDEKTKRELHELYQQSAKIKEKSQQMGSTYYHQRVARAGEIGLYDKVLNSINQLRDIPDVTDQKSASFRTRRLEDFSLQQIDDHHLLVPLSVLLALRQDALVALNYPADPANRMQVANLVGENIGDWPLAMRMVITGTTYNPERAQVAKAPGYLSTAYPAVYVAPILEFSSTYSVEPGMLYALARQESAFNPAALSSHRALGLFQFTKPAYDTAIKLLDKRPTITDERFLIDPALSIQLGAAWMGDKLKKNDGSMLFAVMEHISGPVVRTNKWKDIGNKYSEKFDGDIEFLVETIPHSAARQLARGVLLDLAIVDASGILNAAPPELSNE